MPKVRRLESTKRRAARDSVSDTSSSTPKLVGCPVFDPIDCQSPKSHLEPGEGVKMTCTWDACPYDRIPLHTQCYQALEDNLVKRLGTLGSARGWTPPQRRNNLWEKKGQTLIGKFCRCRCGHGQMTRDKQALYEKEKAVEKEKKKKAKKTKQLPQLQFNSKPSAVIEDKKRSDSDVFQSPSATTATRTFSRTRIFTDRSTTSTIATAALFETMSEASLFGETNGEYKNNSVFHTDTEPEPEDDDAETVIVLAPPPPRQTRSYAETIKQEDLDETKDVEDEEEEEEKTVPSTPVITKPVDSPDSGLERTTPPEPSPTDSEHSETEFFPEISETPRRAIVRSSPSVPKLPLAVKIVKEEDVDLMSSGDGNKPKSEETTDSSSWTPMFGRGFNLGERILYFP